MVTQKKYDKLKAMLIAQRRKNRKINQVKRRRGRSIRQSVEFSTGSQAAKQAINAMSGANDVKFKIIFLKILNIMK